MTTTEPVEGVVIVARFCHLYRLLDLERDAVDQAQRLTMPAAMELLAAYESDEWRRDKQAEFDAYVAEHGWQPQWSPTSERTFVRWVQETAERDGHPVNSRGEITRLTRAAECVRILGQYSNGVAPRGATLPTTEGAWRPAFKLLNHGFRDQIPAMVERAAEIAEAEGKEITSGIMLAARQEVWKTDPTIRQWVEQPGQVENRNDNDRLITIKNQTKAFRRQVSDETWRKFYEWVWEQGT